MAESHKRKRSLQQCIESASLGNLTENQVDAGVNVLSSTGEAKLTDEVQIKKEVAKAIPGSEENMEDSPVRGLMIGLKKMKSDPGLAEDIKSKGAPSESTIKKAVWDRASYLEENLENVTLVGVRRLLEEDLELEKHALDPFKKFVNEQVKQVMLSPDAPEKTTSQKKTNIKKHASGKASSVEEDARPSSKSDRDEVEEDEVKVKKKSSPKGKLQNSEALEKRKRAEMWANGSNKKQNKMSKSISERSSEENGGNVSGDDNYEASAEKPVKKKQVPTPAYGKKVEHLKSVIVLALRCALMVAHKMRRLSIDLDKAKRAQQDQELVAKDFEVALNRERERSAALEIEKNKLSQEVVTLGQSVKDHEAAVYEAASYYTSLGRIEALREPRESVSLESEIQQFKRLFPDHDLPEDPTDTTVAVSPTSTSADPEAFEKTTNM